MYPDHPQHLRIGQGRVRLRSDGINRRQRRGPDGGLARAWQEGACYDSSLPLTLTDDRLPPQSKPKVRLIEETASDSGFETKRMRPRHLSPGDQAASARSPYAPG